MPILKQKHGEFRGYPTHVYRLGTYRTHVGLGICGRLAYIAISIFGRRWESSDFEWPL